MSVAKTIAKAGVYLGLSLLFISMVYGAFKKAKPGQNPCTKGGTLVFFLPIILAVIFTMITNLYAKGQESDWNPNPYVQMVTFTIVLVILQYILSTALIKRHKGVSWGAALKAGIGAALGSLFPSLVAISTFFVLTTFLPNALPAVGKMIWDILQKIPFVRNLYNRQAHWLPAYGIGVGPLLSLIPLIGVTFGALFSIVPWTPLGGFAGHGIACGQAK